MIRRLSRILAIVGLCLLSTAHALSATLAELWAERTPCVVAVEFMIEMETDRQTGNACGTVIDDHGTIILPPMAINLRFTPEQLKDFKVFLPGAVTGKPAQYLGTDALTGWHFLRADESQWAELTPVTRFVPAKAAPAPALGDEVWGLALREKDEDFMPYLLSARVALLNRFPQLTAVAQQEVASPGLPVFNSAGEFVGLALSSFAQTYLQFSRDNPGGMPIMNVNAEESSAFHVAEEVLPYFSRIPTNPHGRPKVWLGTFRLESVTPEVAAFLKLENQSAVMVSEVLENSPAEKAGFKERDIIVALDGQPLPKFRPARVVTGFIDR
ncbi:MAG TPA: PDZ domain-containing protein, partial [Opitutaceae bacterium]|nr:PDZ domain-containing protein [Opitutaceae bacterium]